MAKNSPSKSSLSQFEQDLNKYEKGPIDKLKDLQKRLAEFLSTNEFLSLSIGEQDRVQELIDEVKENMRTMSAKKTQDSKQFDKNLDSQKVTLQNEAEQYTDIGAPHEHNKQAEKWVEDAEGYFYSGRYADAIPLYEKALNVEPSWDRAKKHRDEAEEHLKKGTIPAEALPQEVGILYGKAQSAARFGDYGRAKEMLNSAKQVLTEYKIMRWQEGANFEVQLDNNIAAVDTAREAEKLFRQSKFDDAISKLETVASVTGNPRYKEQARTYQEFKDKVKILSGRLGNKPNLDLIIDVTKEMEDLEQETGENQALERLRARLEDMKPNVGESLRMEITSLKSQAEKAPKIEDAFSLANQAKERIERASELQINDFALVQLRRDINNLMTNLENHTKDLEQAVDSYRKNRSWPSDAWRVSTDVRASYPADPRVSDLSKSFRTYRAIVSGLWGISILITLGLLIIGGMWASQQVKAYSISLITPTVTLTLTPLPTLTPTLPPTMTPTIPPTLTPTPVYGSVTRDVFIRNSCYDSFAAVVPVPSGSRVDLLPSPERRFDDLNRECILVEYKTDRSSYIGWILLKDFSQ